MAKKTEKPKVVQTRKNEVRYTTDDPGKMLGKYLVDNLRRSWTEEFVDESNGELVPIERHELIFQRATLIDETVLSRIMFHQQAGDIKEVEVSNQKREAYISYSAHFWPWSLSASIGGKTRKFLLYATSASQAIEIAEDYIELNFSGHFAIKQVREFDSCFFIKDTLVKEAPAPDTDSDNPDEEQAPAPESTEKEFYKIEVEVLSDDMTTTHTFVLQTKDVDTGTVAINKWLAHRFRTEREKEGKTDEVEFTTTVKSGVVIPCYRIIEKEFSDAYIETEKL
ncbi:MAG: RNA polymerase subunit sigma [Alistipes sp.]|nr:RNA polymerase subunit sigma [Alistipes sp.]